MSSMRGSFHGLCLVVLLAVPSGFPEAQGFREQRSWQFRSASQTQILLNIEALRLQQNGLSNGGGSGGGGTTIGLGAPLGAAALGAGGLNLASGTTVGNSTSGSTTYNVTVTGDGNEITVDGYLNLSTSQISEGQNASVDNRLEQAP